MRLVRILRRDQRGAAALEFALVAPTLILFIVGIAQLGVLFMAQSGLNNAVAEGARCATLWPRPTDATIAAHMTANDYGLNAAGIGTPSIVHGTSDNADYVDIGLTYTVTPDFIFFTLPAVTLTESRRAFIQKPVASPAPATC